MAVNWPDLKSECRLQNPQRIATRNRSVLAGVAGQNDSRIARAIKQPFHVVHPHRPGFIQHNQLPFGQNRLGQQQALQCLRLESFFAQNIRCRRRWRTEQRFNLRLFAGGDQFAQRRGFAAAGQTAQAGNAVTGAQDMINRPALIFAEPVGRPVAGMQRRNRIAARVDRLN